MKDGKLNNRQFVTIAIIIMLCGIAIVGHDYFMAKRANAYEKMSILLSQEPEYVDNSNDRDNTSSSGDTSGKVKKKKVTYNYVGRLRVPGVGARLQALCRHRHVRGLPPGG